MSEQLSGILGHVEALSSLDLSDVPPTSHALDIVNVLVTTCRAPLAARGGALRRPSAAGRRLPGASDVMTVDTLDLTARAASRCSTRVRSPARSRDAYLERIDRIDGDLHCYLRRRPRAGPRRGRTLDSEGRSGIAGVPIAYKDLLCIRGVPTTAGSRVLEGYRPPYDGDGHAPCAAGLV